MRKTNLSHDKTTEQINLTVHSLRNQFMGRRPKRIRRLAHLLWKLLCLFCPDKLLHLKKSLQHLASYPLSLTNSYMLDLQTLICSLQTLTCLDLRKCPCRQLLLYAHIAKKQFDWLSGAAAEAPPLRMPAFSSDVCKYKIIPDIAIHTVSQSEK